MFIEKECKFVSYYKECVRALVQAEGSVNGPTTQGRTPLMFAAKSGNLRLYIYVISCQVTNICLELCSSAMLFKMIKVKELLKNM